MKLEPLYNHADPAVKTSDGLQVSTFQAWACKWGKKVGIVELRKKADGSWQEVAQWIPNFDVTGIAFDRSGYEGGGLVIRALGDVADWPNAWHGSAVCDMAHGGWKIYSTWT